MTTKINGTNTAASPAITGADTDTGLSFGTDTVNINTGGVTRATVDSSGRVGINSTSPTEQLEINLGTDKIVQFTGGIGQIGNVAGMFAVNTAKSEIADFGIMGNTLKFASGTAASGAERMRIDSDGKVLIKTTTDVFGGTDFGVKGQISIANDSAYRRAYLSGSNNNLYFWNGSNQGYLSSSGSWVDASDENLKKDITDLSYGIDSLKTLKPRKFKMKSDDKEQIGFIAQEVESVIPEVVDTGETPDGSQQKGLAYGHLTAVLTKALQEAVAKIEVLETKVAALEAA